MKTGNGANPNPRKVFGGAFAVDNSNVLKGNTGGKFSAKMDVMPKKKTGGPMKGGMKGKK